MHMRRPLALTCAILVSLLVPISSCFQRAPAIQDRPATWAAPVVKPHLPNLHQVDATVWRGAQPDAEGMQELERMGIRTVMNLRSFHSDRDELAGTHLDYEHIWFKTWHPEDEDVVAFLKIINNPSKHPIFVHCQHGSDRTGTMIAIYRMVMQGWPPEEAIREMVDGGFGYHPMWDNLRSYLRALDLDRIRSGAGIVSPQTSAP